jgi:hypothetical protein
MSIILFLVEVFGNTGEHTQVGVVHGEYHCSVFFAHGGHRVGVVGVGKMLLGIEIGREDQRFAITGSPHHVSGVPEGELVATPRAAAKIERGSRQTQTCLKTEEGLNTHRLGLCVRSVSKSLARWSVRNIMPKKARSVILPDKDLQYRLA